MNTYGISGLVFGTPSVTGYVVQSHTVSSKCALVVPIQDENGVVVHRRYDDITTEVTLEAIYKGASVPAPGGTISIDSVTYEVTSIDLKRDNKGYKTVSIKGVTSAGI